jgi:hypothetical protein
MSMGRKSSFKFGILLAKSVSVLLRALTTEVPMESLLYMVIFENQHRTSSHSISSLADVCDHTSFENTRRWIGEIDRYAGDEQPLKMLVGCKVDMDTKRTVSTSDGQELADQLRKKEILYRSR